MTTATTISSISSASSIETAWQDVHSSFERFCLTAGVSALEEMLREDAERLAGPRHSRHCDRAGRRIVVIHPRLRRLDAGTGGDHTYFRDSDFLEWFEFVIKLARALSAGTAVVASGSV